jgi:proline iminopeptidase
MKAKIRGTEIYFDIAGMQLHPEKGDFVERPVVFLLHGGPGGDHLRYKQHSLELQDVAQLVFIDHRGCGRSKKSSQSEYTIGNNIEDIEALRIHLGLKEIVVFGTSYGGMVAQGYATRYPKHVAKLILAVTAPSYRFLADAKAYLHEHGNAQQIAICEHLWNGTFKSQDHLEKYFKVMESLYTKAKSKRTKNNLSKSKTQWSYEALNEGFGNFLKHFDYISKLKKITCPTLVLAGEKDWICRPAQSKIIAKNIPQAKLKIFKNAGHTIAVDVHEEYIKIIKRFLKKP